MEDTLASALLGLIYKTTQLVNPTESDDQIIQRVVDQVQEWGGEVIVVDADGIELTQFRPSES